MSYHDFVNHLNSFEIMTDSYNHILISLLGRTPQILTETLYALMVSRKIPISEIWVLTTQEGFQVITEHLIHPKSGKFYAFCHDWQIDAQKIKFNTEQILVAEDLSSEANAPGYVARYLFLLPSSLRPVHLLNHTVNAFRKEIP